MALNPRVVQGGDNHQGAFVDFNPVPTSLSFLRKKPAKMLLQSVAHPDWADLEAQFNPSEVQEKVQPNYSKLAVLGLSHKPLQYQNTDNHTWDLELAFRVYDNDGNKLVGNARARRFLLAHCYPQKGNGTVIGGAPSRLLFVWPQFVWMTCALMSVSITHTMFGIDGTPYHFAAKLNLEEARDSRIYDTTVYSLGTFRPQPLVDALQKQGR